MFSRRTALWIVTLLLVSMVLGSTVSVYASTSAAGPPSSSGRHCVVRIEPVQPGHVASELSNFRCFATFAEAIASATGGAVRLPATVTPDKVTQDMLSDPGIMTVVIGIDFQHSNYQGATLTWEASSGCSPGMYYYANTMPSGWDNILSSTKAYTGCNKNYSYENTYQGGAVRICYPNCSYIGDAMNDRTSSKKWTT